MNVNQCLLATQCFMEMSLQSSGTKTLTGYKIITGNILNTFPNQNGKLNSGFV